MADLWAYLLAVLGHWVALMSGGIITVLLALWERRQEKTISLKWYLAVIAFFVFLAMFLSWRDQYLARLELAQELEQKHTPRLYIKMLASYRGFIKGTGDGTVTVIASVGNTGMPSIAKEWRLVADMPELGEVEGRPVMIPEVFPLEMDDNKTTVIYNASDALYNKTTTPIVTGGEVTGILAFRFPGITRERLALSSEMRLLCLDVTNKVHQTSDTHDLTGGGSSPMYYPGMKPLEERER